MTDLAMNPDVVSVVVVTTTTVTAERGLVGITATVTSLPMTARTMTG